MILLILSSLIAGCSNDTRSEHTKKYPPPVVTEHLIATRANGCTITAVEVVPSKLAPTNELRYADTFYVSSCVESIRHGGRVSTIVFSDDNDIRKQALSKLTKEEKKSLGIIEN